MIYFHIPFCKQKCSYCNFHFSTSLAKKEDMLDALKQELKMRHAEHDTETISSLYFGGGTPSILQPDELKALIDETAAYFEFDHDIEITLEANPDDLNRNFLKELSNSAVNRLSIGTQSFFEADLNLMNRAHTSSEAESSIKRAQDHGFENISIDLIYGSPVSGMEIWKQNLKHAVELQVPHISSYALTVEPKTALDHAVRTGKWKAPDDALQSDEFLVMCETLKQNGFEHYEISNFAKPGYLSRHNTSYWKNLPYLGIGPSAHSFDGNRTRSWNVANNTLYIKEILAGILPQEKELLSEKEMFNEMLMIGLRTKWGVDLNEMDKKFGDEVTERFASDLKQKLALGELIMENGYLRIPEEKWFFADGIAADLFQLD